MLQTPIGYQIGYRAGILNTEPILSHTEGKALDDEYNWQITMLSTTLVGSYSTMYGTKVSTEILQ